MDDIATNRVASPGQGQDDNPWNREAPYDYSTMWLGTRPCLREINRQISGDPERHWIQHVLDRYILARPPELLAQTRCLLLGANEGATIRLLVGAGYSGEVVATDIADKALARARAKADEAGHHNVRYVIHDLNEPFGSDLAGPFDFIIAEGVLHHIERINRCLAECDRVLAADGQMFLVEFEGPFRFQFSDLQTRWINAALAVIPKCLRPFPPADDGQYPATPQENLAYWLTPPPEDAVRRMDPSEAVSGPQLKAMLPVMFEVVERSGYGGPILSYITQHFDFRSANDDPFAQRWLEVLMTIERTAIETGLLDDEFVFYVLKKRRRTAT